MRTLLAALGAIVMAVKDVLTPRLLFLALICFAVVGALALAAAWAAATWLPPLIPDGTGLVRHLTRTIEFVLGPAGAFVLVLMLTPAIALIVAGLLFDIGAERVERAIGAPKARGVAPHEALVNALRIGAGALGLNLLALPALLIPPLYPIVFLILNGYLFGREFFTQAAVRHMSFAEARALRRRAPVSIFVVGLFCSLVAFIAPLLAASAMPRLVKALSKGEGAASP